MKILNGRELAGFIKERQAHQVRALSKKPKLLILRDSDNPVIMKYVGLKIKYGQDIGVEVEDRLVSGAYEITENIRAANADENINGIIVQLPLLLDKEQTNELCNLIAPEKDVDGLGENARFDSATATAIHWLLTGYDVDLSGKKIALVGRGKLVGMPLYHMWVNSGLDVTIFHRGSDMSELVNYDVIVTATGVPGLITSEMVRPGAVIVDAGTASEKGKVVGDVDANVRARNDLSAITPEIGGVGPLTITCLFEHLLQTI